MRGSDTERTIQNILVEGCAFNKISSGKDNPGSAGYSFDSVGTYAARDWPKFASISAKSGSLYQVISIKCSDQEFLPK